MYKIEYHRDVRKDMEKLKQCNLIYKVNFLIDVVKNNPFQNPPPYQKLLRDLNNYYSRRINIQHRMVYQVFEKEGIVRILSLWSHYENI